MKLENINYRTHYYFKNVCYTISLCVCVCVCVCVIKYKYIIIYKIYPYVFTHFRVQEK